jgi:hypothetical protein
MFRRKLPVSRGELVERDGYAYRDLLLDTLDARRAG